MPAPYGDGQYLNEPPKGDGLVITDRFHIVKPKAEDPDIRSRVDSKYPNVAIITFDAKNQFGGMWAKEQLDLTMPFSTEIYLHLGRQYDKTNTNVADGMTFTLHNDPAGLDAIGGAGEGLGVFKGRKFANQYWQGNPVTVEHGTYLRHSLVIEFDTYRNVKSTDTFVDDPTAPHCSLVIPQRDTLSTADHRNTFSFPHSQNWVKFQVEWTPNATGGGTLGYALNGTSRSYTVSDIKSTFGGSKVWWGFTGSSGELTSVQAAAITRMPSQGVEVVKSVKNADGVDINHGHALPGDILTYTIRVTAKSISTYIGNVIIEDDLPEWVIYTDPFVLIRTSGGETFSIPSAYSPRLLTINTMRNLYAEGDWIEATFSVRVAENAAGETVLNRALVYAERLPEDKYSNTTDVTIFSEPVKRVLDSNYNDINQKPVKPGDTILYEITYANDSDTPVDIRITDELPDGVDYVTSTDGGVYTNADHTVTWELKNVPRITGKVTVTVTVNENAAVKIDNTAAVAIGEGDPQPSNTVTNPVTPELPVKRVPETSDAGKDGSTVKVGDKITYEITYFNYTDQTAKIEITDRLPGGVDYLSADHGGTYHSDTHTVTWSLENVTSGSGGVVTVIVQVNATATVRIENYAYVKVGANDPQITNSVINPIYGTHCVGIKQVTNCRKTIAGHKIWVDNNNRNGTRPRTVEVVLKRDGKVIKSVSVGADSDWSYSFGCLPIRKNSLHEYLYQIDERYVPDGYRKANERYNIRNTLIE